MAKRTRIVKDASGRNVKGEDVGIIESTERFSELRLEDGTVIKIKPSVITVTRLYDQWDAENNPVYVLRSQNIVTLDDVPPDLKRKG